MKHYFAKVVAFIPVPREREFRIQASNMATAMARAMREFRKDFKRKRIDKVSIKIDRL